MGKGIIKLVASLTIGLILVFLTWVLLWLGANKVGVPQEITGVFGFFYIFMFGYNWTAITKWISAKLKIKMDFEEA